ncbi:hypothetical protein BDY21DRAFT_344826, partial [Lineolata rhizophorae]
MPDRTNPLAGPCDRWPPTSPRRAGDAVDGTARGGEKGVRPRRPAEVCTHCHARAEDVLC